MADGGVEQDPELWWTAAAGVLRRLTTQLGGCRTAAVCVDATSGTLLLADRDGQPLGPALMYNDCRARSAAGQIAARAPLASAARGATSGLAKALHLRTRWPSGSEVLALHQADWLAGRLAGRFGFSDWNNALKLGFDSQTEGWPDWLDGLDLAPLRLPDVVPPGTDIGRLDPVIAAQIGLSVETRVVAGTTDSTAAVIAAGVSRAGQAVSCLGSTLVIKILSEQRISDPRRGVYSHRLGDLWLVGGASNSGGAVLRQFFDEARIAALSPRLRPNRPTGLDYYPLPSRGERFPISDLDLAPRLAPRPSDDARFLQGLLEGIAAIEVQGYRLLAELGAPAPTEVVSIGGGARNQPWTEIRRRQLGVPVRPAVQEEAAYGAALLARRGCPPR